MKRLIASLLILACLTGDLGARRWVPKISSAAGPNVWYNAGSTVDTGYNISSNVVWSNVTVASGGTCTKVRIYCWTYYSTTTAYLGLYSGQALISGATGTVSVTGTGWFEATLSTPATVSAGTYQVACVVDSGAVQIGGHADSGITSYLQGDTVGTWPPATLDAAFATYSNQTWGLGMWVQ